MTQGLKLPVFTWTYTGNYPSGGSDWSGQPLALKPAGTYWTPETVPDAEDLNWVMGTQASDALAAYEAAASMQAQNWPWSGVVEANSFYEPTGVNAAAVMAACWDPNTNKWFFIYQGTNSTPVNIFEAMSTSDGVNFTNFTSSAGSGFNPLPPTGLTPNNYFVAMAPDLANPGTNEMWVMFVDSTAPNTARCLHTGTGTWSTGTGYSGSSTIRVSLHNFNGHLLQGFGSAAPNNAAIYRDQSPQVAGITGIQAEAIAFADNGSNMCVAMTVLQTSPGAYWTSPDGVTWTAQSFALVGGGTIPSLGTLTPFGICYTHDAQGDCFLLGFNSASNPVFYRSNDGINWSLQSSPTGFSSAVGTCMSMAACGSVVIVTGSDGKMGAWSPDGGVTWYSTQHASWPIMTGYQTGNNATSAMYCPNTVISNGQKFLFYNSIGFKLSLSAGFGTQIN